MRAAWGLLAVCIAVSASAQTRVDAAVTTGLTIQAKPSRFYAEGAVRIEASRAFDRFTVFGALVGVLNQRLALLDLGSVAGFSARLVDDLRLRVEVFPFNGARVRETFDYSDVVGQPLMNRNMTPLARVMLQAEAFEVWAAFSGYPLLDNTTLENAIAWSGLFGLAARHVSGVTVEARAGVHDRGTVPTLAQQGVVRQVFALVVAGRIAWAHGGGVSAQVDPFNYLSDPERYERFLAPEPYEEHVAAWVGLEGGAASQNLPTPQAPLETRRYTTGYADLQGRLRVGHLRLFLTGRFHPVDFIMFDSPGYPPFTLQENVFSRPRIGGWAGADYRFDRANLELGAQLRVVAPAVTSCSTTLGGNLPSLGGLCSRLLVVQGAGQFSLLPEGKDAEPVFGAMLSVRYSPAPPLVLVTALDYERNGSAAYFNVSGELVSVVSEIVQVKLLAQVKF